MVVVRGDSYVSETTKARAIIRNALRAKLLQPAPAPTFTREDVELLRNLISALPATSYDAGDDERLYRIANKINSLLPPDTSRTTT